MYNHTYLQDVTLPVGSIITFAGKLEKFTKGMTPEKFVTYPELYGWMICDGTPLKVQQYPELYAVLGNLYGTSGLGENMTFCLPDLCGQFLRGIGIDNCSTDGRTAAPNGDPNGVGSTQGDAFQSHVHSYTKPSGMATGGNAESVDLGTISDVTKPPMAEQGAPDVKVSKVETRPTNVFVYFLIKYTYKLPHFQPYSFPAL